MGQPWPPGGPVVSCNWASKLPGSLRFNAGRLVTLGYWWATRCPRARPQAQDSWRNEQRPVGLLCCELFIFHFAPPGAAPPSLPSATTWTPTCAQRKKSTEHKTLRQKESDPPLKESIVFTLVALQHSAIQTLNVPYSNMKGQIFEYWRPKFKYWRHPTVIRVCQ